MDHGTLPGTKERSLVWRIKFRGYFELDKNQQSYLKSKNTFIKFYLLTEVEKKFFSSISFI